MENLPQIKEIKEFKSHRSSMKRKHPFSKSVQEMLKQKNIEYKNYQVVTHLTWAAEHMTIETLETAKYFSEVFNDTKKENFEDYLKMAIELRYNKDALSPNHDACVKKPISLNQKELKIKPFYGIALPKYHLGTVNYKLKNKKITEDFDSDEVTFMGNIKPLKTFNQDIKPTQAHSFNKRQVYSNINKKPKPYPKSWFKASTISMDIKPPTINHPRTYPKYSSPDSNIIFYSFNE